MKKVSFTKFRRPYTKYQCFSSLLREKPRSRPLRSTMFMTCDIDITSHQFCNDTWRPYQLKWHNMTIMMMMIVFKKFSSSMQWSKQNNNFPHSLNLGRLFFWGWGGLICLNLNGLTWVCHSVGVESFRGCLISQFKQ